MLCDDKTAITLSRILHCRAVVVGIPSSLVYGRSTVGYECFPVGGSPIRRMGLFLLDGSIFRRVQGNELCSPVSCNLRPCSCYDRRLLVHRTDFRILSSTSSGPLFLYSFSLRLDITSHILSLCVEAKIMWAVKWMRMDDIE